MCLIAWLRSKDLAISGAPYIQENAMRQNGKTKGPTPEQAKKNPCLMQLGMPQFTIRVNPPSNSHIWKSRYLSRLGRILLSFWHLSPYQTA